MFTTLVSVALVPLALGADALPAGTQLAYKGTVAPLTKDRSVGEAQKTFNVAFFVGDRGDAAAKIYWLVEESGRGRWPWTERFGQVALDGEFKATGTAASLLYDRGEGTSVIPLPTPWLKSGGGKPLSTVRSWSEGEWKYQVEKRTKRAGRAAWQVQVSNSYGRQRVVWVAEKSPLIVAVRQWVFMGMGEEYQLDMELTESTVLSGERLKAAQAAFAALWDLRSRLNRPPRSEDGGFDAKQLAMLQRLMPGVEQAARIGLTAKLVKAATQDLATQSNRAGALEKLAAQQIGRAAPKFALKGQGRLALADGDLKGGVTVLHFWPYRDSPLKQPYGQVGYLDFLYGKRKGQGVKVYGVAVDERLSDPAKRSQAQRGVRKLAKFMNLSYPILYDDGTVLKQFGDPRLLGAPLPLFVVIDAKGKITHYKVGHYKVDRLAGLKQLNEVVGRALEK